MILGERCTRACGFCLVDTRKPLPLDPDEPRRVADAVATLGLEHAVITSVARDDLADGGAAGFAATIAAIRAVNPATRGRGADPRLQGRSRGARRDLRGAARRAEPQPRDGGPAAPRRPAVGGLRPFARAARPRRRCGSAREIGHHPGHGRDRRRGARRDRRPAQRRRRRAHARPVPAAVAPSTCRSRAGGRPPSSPSSARTPRASASATWSPVRSCARATTPSGPPLLPPGSDVYAARLARAQARMRELGVDVLLLSTGADLPYLTGYEAMPLERLTMLVLPADGDAVLVIPRLEAPASWSAPMRSSVLPWDETDDPIDVVAGLVDGSTPRRLGRDRRPHLGPVRPRSAARAPRRRLPPRHRRHRAAAGREGRRRDRGAPRARRASSTTSPR